MIFLSPRHTIAVGALLMAQALGAQQAHAQASAPAAPPSSSPAKKELVARILKLQRPVIESLAQGITEEPASQLMQQASMALQERVSGEKRDAVAKDIQADVKKYLAEAAPIMKDKAIRLAPATVGAILEEKFSEEELKQLIGILESPVNIKMQDLGMEMQRSLGNKLMIEARAEVEPKVRSLQQSIAKRLDIPVAPVPGASAPAAKPAGK